MAGNLSQSGTISISTLTNNGYISGSTNVGVGTSVNATIGTLTNTGTAGVIGNAGTISALNNSGTISNDSGYAVYNAGSGHMGAITNTGIIAGTIYNRSIRDLTINGDTGAGVGTLTGISGSIGNIFNTSANLIFGTGKLLLNDHINVGANTVQASAGSTLLAKSLKSTFVSRHLISGDGAYRNTMSIWVYAFLPSLNGHDELSLCRELSAALSLDCSLIVSSGTKSPHCRMASRTSRRLSPSGVSL